jgi:hypothetical protein
MWRGGPSCGQTLSSNFVVKSLAFSELMVLSRQLGTLGGNEVEALNQ